MKKLIDVLNDIVQEAFVQCGYASQYGVVTLSNRPDLCQFQCNGALAAAKAYKKAPFIIATEVCTALQQLPSFSDVTCVMPGFINLTLHDQVIVDYLEKMAEESRYGCEPLGQGETIIVDYGGPNVAKPLHIGHLRTAIIGESIKRLGNFLGYQMLGDVHLGDWGLPIGLIIIELEKRKPHLPYFSPTFESAYPTEAPFTISELESIYPTASSFAKENPSFMEKAKQATFLFQSGHKGYVALWQHILQVSMEDLKKNYSNLNVSFELWKKESDSQPYIPEMIETLKEKGFAYRSEGALVVDVKEAADTKEMPPCLLVKSDGATLYSTTDLATIVERMALYAPLEIIYIVDKRQEMHFEQVFRCAKKTGLITPDTKLTFLGFGTMNGKDGKPFKTRDGGVMRLETLIHSVSDKVYERVIANEDITFEEAKDIAHKVGIAALKYGDLSNQIAKDYIFDLERFASFEGNTGPYILYTVVRIQAVLQKFYTQATVLTVTDLPLQLPSHESERDLMLTLTQLNDVLTASFIDYSPHKICQYIYELANAFNRFYHNTQIIREEDLRKQYSWIKVSTLTKDVLTLCLDLLGIEVPTKM
ncbi:MAG: arginine--tRNA ligase [Cellulosilyticaceae bacterium]